MRSTLAASDVDCRRRSLETAIRESQLARGFPRFVGSKGGAGVWQRIISEMPPHAVYVEPFAGKGIVALNKKPATSTIVIDADPAAPAFQSIPAAGLSGLRVICGDAISQLTSLRPTMNRSWLIYADPPYLGTVRSCQRNYYRHEMKSTAEHHRLLLLLLSLPALVMISGYESAFYDHLLADWRKVTIPTVTRGGSRATEVLWLNFPEPFAFHDTRWLGQNFRERERIKRKKLRWKTRLASMSRLDRAAVLDAIGELASS